MPTHGAHPDGGLLFQRKPWLAFCLLTIAVLAAYGPAIRGGYIWDDDSYVTENRTLTQPGGLKAIWTDLNATPQYYPLVHSSYWIEHRLWGFNPMGYHVVNVLLHCLCSLLLWRVLRMLGVPGALLAAALFALHPVHVESAAWITERKNVLSGCFYMGSALCMLRFFEEARNGKKEPFDLYAAGLILFSCALLSKTVAASLPAALLVVLWFKHGRIRLREAALLLPFFAAGAGFGLLTAWLEQHRVGAVGAAWDMTLVERCLVAGRAVWFYAIKLAAPFNLGFNYPRWTIDARAWTQFIPPVSALMVLALFWGLRRRLSRGPLAAALFFGGTLFPALGFFSVYPFRYSFVADHFQYLASAGMLALFAAILVRAWKGKDPRTGAALAMALLALLAAGTWRQSHAYADAATLWEHTLARNPASYLAHNNLGLLLLDQGRQQEALDHFRQAIDANPREAGSYANLGAAFKDMGFMEESVKASQKSLELDPNAPIAHNNLGAALDALGRTEEAVFHLRTALDLDPGLAEAHNNLGRIMAAMGKEKEAARHYAEALTINPDFANAHVNLAVLLASRGYTRQAEVHFQAALEARPGFFTAHYNYGVLLQSLDRFGEAEEHFSKALRLAPGDAPTLARLGLLMEKMERTAQAREYYERALQLAPAFPEALEGLGRLSTHDGKAND